MLPKPSAPLSQITLRRSFPHAMLLVALGLTAPLAPRALAAEPASVDERLQQLEKTVQSLKDENKDLKTQLGWDTKKKLVFVTPGSKESKLVLGGFIQGQAEFGKAPDARYTDVDDRFLLRRARINLSGNLAENFDFKIEADFGANTLAGRNGFSGQLTDAFVNWNRNDFANVKFGQFKTPFGYEQLLADTKVLTVERSLGNDRLTDGRQIGLGVSGDFLKKRLGYSAGVFNGSTVNTSSNDNDSFLFAGRVTGVPVETKLGKEDFRWALGLNGLASHDGSISKSGFGLDLVPGGTRDNLFAGDRYSWGADSQMKWGRFGLDAEYLRSHFEPNDNIPAGSFDAEGWYVTLTGFILPQKLQGLVKYDAFDPNLSVGNDQSETLTFGLIYFLRGDDLKLTVNYLLGLHGAFEDQGRLLARVQLVF